MRFKSFNRFWSICQTFSYNVTPRRTNLQGDTNAMEPPPPKKNELLIQSVSFPARNSPQRIDVRAKQGLAPGHSMLDWANLTRTQNVRGEDFRPRGITREELAEHCTKEDCWIVLDGRVYNVTRYLPFHPGGKGQLLRGAGKDATELFQKYHPWVNADALLERCFLGPYLG
jgi:cytochrome b involved in lipid metabolism